MPRATTFATVLAATALASGAARAQTAGPREPAPVAQAAAAAPGPPDAPHPARAAGDPPARGAASGPPWVSATLEWDARGAGCPTRGALERAIEAHLGREVFAVGRADVVVRGAARPGPTGHYRAELVLLRRDGHVVGTRELSTTSPECGALAEALPLVLALMVDLPRAHVSLRIAPRPPPLQPVPGARAAAAPWGWGLSVGPTLSLGLLPGVHAGARVGLELRAPALVSLRVSGSLLAPSESRSALGASASWAAFGGAAACLRARPGESVALEGCAGADLGRFEAEGRGFERNARDAGLLASLAGSAGAGLRLGGPWWLGVETRLLVPLVRRVFTVSTPSEEQRFFQTWPVALDAGVALTMRFQR